ncbi:MAG TPA: SRPBCC domain-containing protein [Candidatus Limnocylindrales bacterium]|nr:SRPBCC domain-containing protein [Candidatus Limnocylindrales bacterium]
MTDRVELQAELDAPRAAVFELMATADGLRRWLDEAELDERVGGSMRIRMSEATAEGEVLSLQPMQHISFSWDWVGEPLGRPSVVAFDAIDHGARTHVTIRHAGLRGARQLQLHEDLWRHWLGRLVAAARADLPPKVETTHP